MVKQSFWNHKTNFRYTLKLYTTKCYKLAEKKPKVSPPARSKAILEAPGRFPKNYYLSIAILHPVAIGGGRRRTVALGCPILC
jgi:hypothetical protein